MEDRIAIVIPAYNEERCLRNNAMRLYEFIGKRNPGECNIIISDNNSTDSTADIAHKLSEETGGGVIYHFEPRRGKGAAIKSAWLGHNGYGIYSFMDADLATDIEAFPRLIVSIRNGMGVSMGCRYMKGAHAERTWKRERVSRCYRSLFRTLFGSDVHDPQCGFKAISRHVRDNVLPYVESDDFFFDTELIIRAVRAGYRVDEVPVNWSEGSGSTVHLLRDAPRFLYQLARLKYIDMKGNLIFPSHKHVYR